MNPRIAPTMMKTVPSGKVLCCMNGAFAVEGTVGVMALTPPVKVGRPDGRAPFEVAVVPVMTGIEPVAVSLIPEPVIDTSEAFEVDPLVVFAVLEPVVRDGDAVLLPVLEGVSSAVERLGKDLVAIVAMIVCCSRNGLCCGQRATAMLR